MESTLRTFAGWEGLGWGGVDVEALSDECKRLAKDIKALPRAVSAPGAERGRRGQSVAGGTGAGWLAAPADELLSADVTCPDPIRPDLTPHRTMLCYAAL